MPEDKWVAVSIAALRCAVSAGAGRNKEKAECKWVATGWQLADCLTKFGLFNIIVPRIESGTTRLHELSAKAKKTKGVRSEGDNDQFICYWENSGVPLKPRGTTWKDRVYGDGVVKDGKRLQVVSKGGEANHTCSLARDLLHSFSCDGMLPRAVRCPGGPGHSGNPTCLQCFWIGNTLQRQIRC